MDEGTTELYWEVEHFTYHAEQGNFVFVFLSKWLYMTMCKVRTDGKNSYVIKFVSSADAYRTIILAPHLKVWINDETK